MIEYSPFDTNVKSHDLNVSASGRIGMEEILVQDTLKFALFSDVHENYDDMADAIKSINAKPDLRFAVSCGDITCSGFVQEYKWYLETAGGLNCPLITVIGNHDYLANGLDIYKKLFGDPNISFVCGKYKFIVFDCAMMENYNVSPKYEWLINELSDSSHVNILISHIPPFANDLDHLNRLVLNNILKSGNVKLCLHGHFHQFRDVYYNDIHTIVADEIKSREYYVIKLISDQSFVETIKF
jgi:Icc-related predicted phosphoesterase